MVSSEDAIKLARETAANLALLKKGNAARLSKYLGTSSNVNKKNDSPTFFAWPAKAVGAAAVVKEDVVVPESNVGNEERTTEYNECYKVWDLPKQEKIVQPQSWSSPITLSNDRMDASNWKSEQRDVYQVYEEGTVGTGDIAGFTTTPAIKAPTFFAWALTKKEKAVTVDEAVQTPENAASEAVEDVVEEPVKDDVDVIADSSSAAKPVESVSPVGLYDTYMDPSIWASEYDTMTAAADNVDSGDGEKAAGKPNILESELPCFFAWGDSTQVQPAVSEYSGCFVKMDHVPPLPIVKKEPRERKNKNAKGPVKLNAPYASDVAVNTVWKSEYNDKYIEAPAAVEEEQEQPIITSSTSHDDYVIVDIPPATTAPAAAQSPIIKSTDKTLYFTSEYSDKFQWPTTDSVRCIRVPKSNANHFISASDLDITDVNSEAAFVEKRKKAIKQYSVATESRSKYSWPDKSMAMKECMGKKSGSKQHTAERNSNCIYHIDAATTNTVMSVDSLTPVVDSIQDGDDNSNSYTNTNEPRQSSFYLDSAGPSSVTGISISKAGRKPTNFGVAKAKRPVLFTAGNAKAASYKAKLDSSNPVMTHRRYPGTSDRQNGRWTTESGSSFTWKSIKKVVK